MDVSALLSADSLNSQPLGGGLSLAFILIFFAPLVAVALFFFLYAVLARGSVVGVAKVLSVLWLLACIPASLMMLMGYAFNSSGMNPLLTIPLWALAGLLPLWVPVALRKLFGVRPV